MADERREPEDGQRLPARRVEDGRRHRPPGRGPPQGRDALAVRRPGGDRRGYRKGHTYPTVVRRTDPKGQLYRSWRLEEPLRLLGLSLERRMGDVFAFFDHPNGANGPTEAINGRLETLRDIALGFRNLDNYITRSLLHTGGFRQAIQTHL